MKNIKMYFFVFTLNVCSLSLAQSIDLNKTITINIGFECLENCAKLKGVKADLVQFEKTSKLLGISHSITITNEEYSSFPNKEAFLKNLKSKIAGFETVHFNYSGHGVPLAKTKDTMNDVNSPNFSTQNFNFLFLNEYFAKCLAEESKKNIALCQSPCIEHVNKKYTCALEAQKYQDSCRNLKNFKKIEACFTNIPATLKEKVANCDLLKSETQLCNNKCIEIQNKKTSGYSSIGTDFSTETQACLKQHGLTGNDFEELFKDKKVLGHIDACYAGLLSNFKNENALLALSSSAEQLSTDSKSGGVFTLAKIEQLENNFCKYNSGNSKPVTVADWYKKIPDLSKNKMSPLVVDHRTQFESVVLPHLWHCESNSEIRPTGTNQEGTHQ